MPPPNARCPRGANQWLQRMEECSVRPSKAARHTTKTPTAPIAIQIQVSICGLSHMSVTS
jgi:hypothetical protein